MAGPGGWRDKEVTDLGHLPVSRGRPSPPKCSLLRVLSVDGGDRRPKAWLGQDFDKTATAGGGPGSGLAGKAPPGYPGCSKLTERQRAGGEKGWWEEVAIGWCGPQTAGPFLNVARLV